VSFFNKLRLPGQPRLADAAERLVRDIVGSALGSLNSATGSRVADSFALVPQKNFKTKSTNYERIGTAETSLPRQCVNYFEAAGYGSISIWS
jgi:hypothetical protein